MKKKKRKVRRRKLKVGRIILALFFLIILCLGIYFVITTFLINDEPKKGPKIANDKKEKVEEKVSTASLIMVGDNLIHSSIYKDANNNASGNGYDFKPMVTYIKEIVTGYDIAYYNQETILGGSDLGLSDYPTFNSPYEAGDAMIDAGFNLVSLATNHTIDRGSSAVMNSCDYWNNKEGIFTAGSYCSEEERNEVKTTEVNDITYSMLNYTYGTNGIPVPSGKEYLVNVWPTDLYLNDPERDTEYQNYKETVKEDIAKVRDKVDILIVAMHWGVEYTHTPTEYQQDMANFLAEQDVDIIIGTHPHVIQPVTWIDDTLVVYSLGNFISAQYQNDNYNKMVGLMTSLEITKKEKGDNVEIEIGNINNELIYTYYSSYRNFKVVPFSSPDIGNYLPSYSSVYEDYKAIVQKYDDTMPVEPLAS